MNQYIPIFSTISVYWSYSLGLDFAYPKYLSFGRGKLNEKIIIEQLEMYIGICEIVFCTNKSMKTG